MENNKIYNLWLSTLSGIGPKIAGSLILKYETAKNLYFLNSDEIDLLSIPTPAKLSLKNKNTDKAKYIYKMCCEKGIDIIEYESDLYPPLLREISDPPMILYKKGIDIDFRKYPIASVVGSRLISEYGKYVTEKISYDLAKIGFLVVSGMALGADAYAHLNALKGNLPTVAVLGCGVDVVYPYENTELYNYIIKYGAVISEYPPETKPDRFNFPKRNRIVSGMSHLTIVTESRLKSGSLITAKLAHEQNKAVFAVPQNINSPYGQGTNQILKEYAKIITTASDAWDYYVKTYQFGEYTPILKKSVTEKQAPKKETLSEYINLPNLNEDEKKIIDVLKNGIAHINKISLETGFPLGKINGIATLLEIRGLIYPISGNAYGLVSPEIWNTGKTNL